MAKKSKRLAVSEELSITSMMDMMTIILVFLLKSYSTEEISVQASELALPVSTSQTKPKMAVNVVVSKHAIVVDGEKVVDLEEVTDPATGKPTVSIPDSAKRGSEKIVDLYDKLVSKAETAKKIGERAGSDEFGFKGQVLLQCDKELPFKVIRSVMYTAGQAQFGEFRFVVIKQE